MERKESSLLEFDYNFAQNTLWFLDLKCMFFWFNEKVICSSKSDIDSIMQNDFVVSAIS